MLEDGRIDICNSLLHSALAVLFGCSVWELFFVNLLEVFVFFLGSAIELI